MPKEAGYLFTIPWDSDKIREQPTVQCCHCGRHWAFDRAVDASAKGNMGYCSKCDGVHCAGCAKCIPQEKWLDWKEKGVDLTGADLDRLPVSVPVHGFPKQDVDAARIMAAL